MSVEGTELQSVRELLRVFEERWLQNHATESSDTENPWTVGWRDLNTGERFFVSLSGVNQDASLEVQAILRTPESRAKFFDYRM